MLRKEKNETVEEFLANHAATVERVLLLPIEIWARAQLEKDTIFLLLTLFFQG